MGANSRVVIVGGGFGGLSCARALDGKGVDVTLIDEQNYHLFTPLLYQVATALLDPSDIAYPLRTRFRHSPNVRFRQARVDEIDFGGKRVRLNDGSHVEYDDLVLATGSTNNYFGNQALASHTIGMKTLEEAMRLRNHVLACLEHAGTETDPEERRGWLTFVIVGGGPTGVEYAGALHELLNLVLGRDYPSLSPDEARILLVEGQDRLLNGFAPSLGKYAKRMLENRGVTVKLGVLVMDGTESSALLSDGEEIATRTIVWSAGVRPQSPALDPEPAESRSHRVEVDERLRIKGAENAYAIGDIAGATQRGQELLMMSPPAMQEGRYVARSILASVGLAEPNAKPFRYFDKGEMATIGRNAAVAQIRFIRLRGFIGWVAWLTVHLYYLIGFRNRIAVLMSWGWNYLRRDRPIRIIAAADPDPVVARMQAS